MPNKISLPANRSVASWLRSAVLWAAFIVIAAWSQTADAQKLNEFALDRWAKLTETQRYQLQIAEKYLREKNYKVAAAEYEKYLTLYEESEAGPYAQLQWSVCQVQLRQSNTAIKDGFQSVIDYWPDSPEAVVAAYSIGSTYKGMGRIPQAKKALRSVVKDFPGKLATVYALSDLVEIAKQENDEKAQLEALKQLSFDTKRNKANAKICNAASIQLAKLQLEKGAFDAAVQAVSASYEEGLERGMERDNQLAAITIPAIAQLATEDTQAQCDKLTAAAIAYLRQQLPTEDNEAAKRDALQYWLHIASMHAASGDLEQTPKVYEQIFRQYGPNDEILRRLAEWHKTQDNYDQARATYRRFADKAEGMSQVAYSFRQQNNIPSAVQAYQQLVGLDPDNAVKWQGEIAATYRGSKQYEKAIAEYESLLATDIEHAESWRWLIATAYEDWGKYPEAIGHFRQCTNFPENYKRMASCQRRLKKPAEAIILYNQVMSHEASAPWALLQIAYTREEAQQKEQAIKTFQLVCKRFPKDRYASTAHAHLQNKYKISVTLGGAKDE